MTSRNASQRRRKKRQKKGIPPLGMIAIGAGVLLVGVAALFVLNNADNAVAGGVPDEYSSVPMSVEYPAPELKLTTLQGESAALGDYRGQVVLLNLWATWCPPCKAELPVLQAYYEKYADAGFVIIGVEDGEPVDVVEQFIKTTNVTYPIWIDQGYATEAAFSAFSLPSSFVIDRDGTVRLAWTGAISMSMLEEHVTPVIEN